LKTGRNANRLLTSREDITLFHAIQRGQVAGQLFDR